MTAAEQPALFLTLEDAADRWGPPAKPKRRDEPVGPVYQGVGKAIRHLERQHATADDPKGRTWATRHAGTIAQARSLARSIDRGSGDYTGWKPASGVSLATMHERLAELLAQLDPVDAATGPDPFDKLLASLAAPPPLETPPRSTNG